VKVHQFHLNTNDSWPAWEIGNPYKDRVATRLGGDLHRAELLQMLLFMLEGSVNTYYGDELGIRNVEVGKITNTQNPEFFVMRSPMQWDETDNAGFSSSKAIDIPVNDDYATNNLKTATGKSASAARTFRKMAEWRINDEGFLYEQMEVGPQHESLVAIKRNGYVSSPNYYAVLNFANKTLENIDLTAELNFTLPSSSSEPTVGIVTSNLASEFRSRDAVDVKALKLAPYSGIVIKYK